MTYFEVVLKTTTWRDRALAGTRSAIHRGSSLLEDTMPVESGGLITESVVHIDHNPVSYVHVYLGARPLPVDAYDRPGKPIRARSHPCDVPIVSNSLGE